MHKETIEKLASAIAEAICERAKSIDNGVNPVEIERIVREELAAYAEASRYK